MAHKVLLVTSACTTKNKFWTCSITSPIGSLMPPCDLASIAGVLRQSNIESKILDLRLYKDPYKLFKDEIDTWKPNSIVTNMATATVIDDYPMLKIAKEKVEKRIVFGFHAMALPDDMFEHGVTHILAGDPEYSILSAITGNDNDKGIWTKNNQANEIGWIDNLDELPYPAIDLYNKKAYHSVIMQKRPFSILLANRGCPYSCSYCVIPFLFGRRVRTMSVERVVGEIERDLKDFNIDLFFFIDSAINLKPEWTARLCEEILSRGLKINWCSNMRVSPVSRELLKLMKRSGCFRLFYGVEDLDLIEQLNRKTTREITKNAFDMTKESGIETVAFLILFPDFDKSEKNMAKRINSMCSFLKPDAIQCNLAIPYPGSQIYDEYMEKYNMSRNWSLYDPAGNQLPYPTDIDLIKVRSKVYTHFFLEKPEYVWNTFRKAGFRSIINFAKNSSKILFRHKRNTA